VSGSLFLPYKSNSVNSVTLSRALSPGHLTAHIACPVWSAPCVRAAANKPLEAGKDPPGLGLLPEEGIAARLATVSVVSEVGTHLGTTNRHVFSSSNCFNSGQGLLPAADVGEEEGLFLLAIDGPELPPGRGLLALLPQVAAAEDQAPDKEEREVVSVLAVSGISDGPPQLPVEDQGHIVPLLLLPVVDKGNICRKPGIPRWRQ
jgi:hypothetical protein